MNYQDKFTPSNAEPIDAEAKRWENYFSKEPVFSQFRLNHQKLITRARFRPPEKPGRKVTDFTDWIYRLYTPEKNDSRLEQGLAREREIAKTRIPVPKNSDWELIFTGMGDNHQDHAEIISALQINGKPMVGKPDLVFKEKKSNRILIVEIKTSTDQTKIPSDGWPNLKAQLWAYSKIDAWKNAPEIILIGEIWGFKSDKVWPCKTICWKSNFNFFDAENAELFKIYKSHCESI